MKLNFSFNLILYPPPLWFHNNFIPFPVNQKYFSDGANNG